MRFIPHEKDTHLTEIDIPYFEDVRTDTAPGYATEKSLNSLKDECVTNLAKLGAGDIRFTSGIFPGDRNRHGFFITFRLYGTSARITIAGFPLRKETPKKIERVLKQSLFVFRNWLEGEVQMRIYHPEYLPLTQYLTSGDGQPTVMEALRQSGNLPLLKG
jgi:hypothetical protein